MAKDSKKSFFELNQENQYKSDDAVKDAAVVAIKAEARSPDHNERDEKEEGELDASVVLVAPVEMRKEIKFMDMDNALDYEDVGSEQEDGETVSGGAKKHIKSESMALAFGVQVKPNDLADEQKATAVVKEKIRRGADAANGGKDEPKVGERSRKERSVERTKNDRNNRGARNRSRTRSPQRRHENNGSGHRVERGGRGGRSVDQSRRRRSRSVDRKSRRSPDRRVRSRSRDRRRRSKSRSHRNRSRSRSRSRDRRTNRRGSSRSPSKSSRRDRERKSRDATPPPPPTLQTTSSSTDEKERLAKEKMMKRAEALLLLKDHMRKEIEEQKRQAELRAREPPAKGPVQTDGELALLEQLKSDTLDKLRKQEEIKQLAAVKKVLEVVAAGVKNAHKKKRSNSSSSSSSSSSEEDRKASRSDRRKRSRKYSSSD